MPEGMKWQRLAVHEDGHIREGDDPGHSESPLHAC